MGPERHFRKCLWAQASECWPSFLSLPTVESKRKKKELRVCSNSHSPAQGGQLAGPSAGPAHSSLPTVTGGALKDTGQAGKFTGQPGERLPGSRAGRSGCVGTSNGGNCSLP
jgi:hypothetical protein